MTREKLLKRYPKIFRQKDLPMTETCMCWGIECGDGWLPLINALCSHLQFMTDKNGYPQVEAEQVKEKFGTLRFYHTFYKSGNCKYEYMNGVIDFACFLSGYICERCGSVDNVTQTEGWIKSLCKKCMEEHNEKKGIS